jgi:hypothetical protein
VADVAISYSHLETPLALALRLACRRAGLTVWMDLPETGVDAASERGIPVGRDFWGVIDPEFARASVILAIDTPAWRASADCQTENSLCKKLGKWIVNANVASVEGLAHDLAQKVAEKRQVLTAHARIAARVVIRDHKETWLQRWQGQSRSTDALIVLGNGFDGTGLSISPSIRAIANADIHAAQASIRRVRTAATTAITVFVVLAIGAGIALLLANRFSEDALASAHRAQALALSASSAKNTDSLAAIVQAQQASRIDPGGPGDAALTAAITADKRLRTLTLPPDNYVGGAWAASSPVVLAYTLDHVVAVNTGTGETKAVVTVPNQISPGLFVAGAKGRTAIYVDVHGELTWLDLSSGTTHALGIDSVTSLDISDDGLLWWGTAKSTLSWAPYPTVGNLAGTETTALPTVAVALDAVSTELAYVGKDAAAHLLRRTGSSVSETSSIALDQRKDGMTGSYRASISDCGGVLYGSYDPSLTGYSFRWDPTERVITRTRIARSSAPVCANTEGYSSDATRGDVRNAAQNVHLDLGTDTNRYFAVSDPVHKRFAELSPAPARLFVINPDTMTTEEVRQQQIAGQIVFDDRVWLIGADERLVDAATGEIGGSLPGTAGSGPELAQYIERIGCDAILGTVKGLFHVGCDGTTALLPIDAAGGRALRAGSDGKHFVLTTHDSIWLLHLDGTVATTVRAPWATTQNGARDADLSPDGSRVAVVDRFGALHIVSLVHPEHWTTKPGMAPAGVTQIAFTHKGDLLIYSSDNLLRLVRLGGATVAVQPIVTKNAQLRVEGGEVILSSLSGVGSVFDERTLAVEEHLPIGVFALQANGTLRGLALYSEAG